MSKKILNQKNNSTCHNACMNGYFNIVKYLHQKIGFVKVNFQIYDLFVGVMTGACNDNINYLLEVFK